jgi:hypothetical protein
LYRDRVGLIVSYFGRLMLYNGRMLLRRISSLWTVFHKFVLPSIFVIGFLNVLIWGPRTLSNGDSIPAIWFFYVMPLVFIAFTLWLGWRLKWVAVDETNRRLYVSNYRKEIAIPFSEIAAVTEFKLSDPRRITIKLHNPTEFGQKIVFLGTYRFGGWLAGPHPIVKELRALASHD